MSASHPTTTAQLDAVAGLLQTSQIAQARQLLAEFMRVHPHVAQAHWLLGTALLISGDAGGAEQSAREAMRLDATSASPYTLLGEALASQGRVLEAEAALRQAITIQPRAAQAVTTLANLLLTQARRPEALRLLDAFIRIAGPIPGVLVLRAHVLSLMGNYADAVRAFQQAVAAAPYDESAHLGLAAALADSGQYAAATDAITFAIANGQDGAQPRFVLARILLGQQRLQEAEAEFRNAIRMRPDFIQAHVNLAETLWMRTADARAVGAQIDSSVRMVSEPTALLVLKAKLLEASGDPDAALAGLDSALASTQRNPALHLAAGQIAVKRDARRALAHAEQAWKLQPRDRATLGAYGNALLAAGQADQAEAFAGKLLAIDANDGLAIALRATAWRMRSDPRYRAVYAYNQFVRASVIHTPDGWPNLPHYLDDLARSLLKLHSFRTHPIGQSLRNGTQVELSLEHATDPAIRAFAQAIDAPIRQYMQALGTGTDPLRRRNSGRYRLNGAWSVRLRPGGYHFNHFHPDGWLSSACYVQIPRELGAHEGEGWLQFGEPGFPTTPLLPPEYFVRPEPGLLVLFPSWFWHGTVPFSGAPTESRLTIAFDVVPA